MPAKAGVPCFQAGPASRFRGKGDVVHTASKLGARPLLFLIGAWGTMALRPAWPNHGRDCSVLRRPLPFRMLLLMMGAAVLLSLGGLTAWQAHGAIQRGFDASRESSLELARLGAAHYGQFVRESEDLLRRLAGRPFVRALAAGACDPLLPELHELLPLITTLVVVRNDGTVVCSSLPNTEAVSVREQPGFAEMIASPGLHVTEPMLGPLSGLWTTAISHPVLDPAGRRAGRILLGVRLERFQSVLDKLLLPEGAALTLLSAEGRLLARLPPMPERIGDRVDEFALPESAVGAEAGTFEAHGLDGVARIYGYDRVPGSGWKVYAGVPREAALAAGYESALEFVAGYAVTAVVLLAMLFMAYAWIRRSVEGLRAAFGAAGSAEPGVVAHPLAVSGPRELRDAAAAFNSLFEQLRLSDERLRLVGRATTDAVWDWDLVAQTLWWNVNFQTLFGYRPDQIEPGLESWTGRLHPDDLERVQSGIYRVIEGDGTAWSDEYRFRRADGTYADIFDRGFVMRDVAGRAVRMVGAMQDVSERHQQQERIMRLSRMRSVMSGINAVIVRARGRAELFKEACRIAVDQGGFGLAWVGMVRDGLELEPVAMAGADGGHLRGLRFRIDGRDAGACQPTVLAIRDGQPHASNDIASDKALGPWHAPLLGLGYASLVAFPLSAGNKVVGCFNLYSTERDFFDEEEMKLLAELASDISYALEFMIRDEQLDFLSIYDPLTQLPNRTLFMRRLPGFIQAAKDSGRRLALLILDIERFKAINDALGQSGGDELLKQIGERLRFHAGGTAHVARVSGDRFAAVIPDLAPDADPERLVQRDAWDRFDPPFEQDGQEFTVSFKVGVAVFPQDGADAEALLRNAELALKHAKVAGGRVTRYTATIGDVARQKQQLNRELRNALEHGELLLHYQPKVDLRSGAICGAEALLRWDSPERGLVGPANFIPLMEETGLILDVGNWVLERALAQSEQWRSEGLDVPRVGVNVSAVQLRETAFVDAMRQLLERQPALGAGIELEITESVMMVNPEAVVAALRTLRSLGVALAMDDFGTGYSSLSYLARLPLNCVKVDRSFVVGMMDNADTLHIVSSIIALAHSMNLRVVAEGVETPEQVARLRALGCDEIQGFVFSKAVPPEEFARLLRERRAL